VRDKQSEQDCNCWMRERGATGQSLKCPYHGPLLTGPNAHEWRMWAFARAQLFHTGMVK
jgi:hypothetical protein